MDWIIGGWRDLGVVAGKAVLMYLTALLALRLGERRTLAQWTIIDFATAVATGAIIGRTSIAHGESFITGAVALVTLTAVHSAASLLRFNPLLAKLFDHRVRVLVADGRLRHHELRRCGLTENDVQTQLRQQGVFDLSTIAYVLYETKGSISIVRRSVTEGGDDADILSAALEAAVGYP